MAQEARIILTNNPICMGNIIADANVATAMAT
jgi:hypothetical protein